MESFFIIYLGIKLLQISCSAQKTETKSWAFSGPFAFLHDLYSLIFFYAYVAFALVSYSLHDHKTGRLVKCFFPHLFLKICRPECQWLTRARSGSLQLITELNLLCPIFRLALWHQKEKDPPWSASVCPWQKSGPRGSQSSICYLRPT